MFSPFPPPHPLPLRLPPYTAIIQEQRAYSSRQATCLSPLPDMSILGSSNLAANRDMMSKIWTNGDSII